MDRGAWWATKRRLQRVRHDLATEHTYIYICIYTYITCTYLCYVYIYTHKLKDNPIISI